MNTYSPTRRSTPGCVVRRLAMIAVCLVVGLLECFAASLSAAEERSWEITPYRVLVWLQAPTATVADTAFVARLQKQLACARQTSSGAAWSATITIAPAPLERWLTLTEAEDDEANFVSFLEQNDLSIDQWDRIILLSLSCPDAWHIQLREFDTLTRTWGDLHQHSAAQTELLVSSILRLMYARFAPLAEIERVENNHVALTSRAAILVQEEMDVRQALWNAAMEFAAPINAPVWREAPLLAESSTSVPGIIPGQVTKDDAFRPVLRKNDRAGHLAENGIRVMPWTFIGHLRRDEHGTHGTLWSGYGQPLPGRRNIRTQRLALAIRSAGQATQLRLVSKDAPDQPLAGYEVYAKGLGDRAETMLLGMTDNDGQIEIGPGTEGLVRLLYVRSGGNLLARLPLVPGLSPTLTASVTDDSPRLAAEGFIEGWRDQVVDTLAWRQVLAHRIQRKIDAGNLAEAERWLRELKSGRTIGELAFELRAARGEFLAGGTLDPEVRRRIAELFEKGQKLIAQDRSMAVEAELTRALEAARQSAVSR